ncbi:MAG: hypothetical protein Q7U59_14255 [Lutibacter sp.]|nr:hypothetical protein [Lutibacter sp.]
MSKNTEYSIKKVLKVPKIEKFEDRRPKSEVVFAFAGLINLF